MILTCSAGHKIDGNNPFNWHKQPGDKCGLLMVYDMMGRNKYCQRKLKIKMDEKLEYAMKCVAIIERDLQRLLVAPGNKKSYASACVSARDNLARLRREIELWEKEGLLPEVLSNGS